MSVLAWARQPPGAPGHRALARLVEQLTCLRAIGLDPACAEGVHPERLRKLAREGARFTAQHLRALSPLAPPRHPGRHRARHHHAPDRRRRRPVRPCRGPHVPPRRDRASRTPCCAMPARSTTRCALLAKLGAALIKAKREWRRPQRGGCCRRSAGTGWRRASPRPSAWRGPTRRICRRLPHVPGRCCTGSGRCSSTPSDSAPYRPRPATLRAVEALRAFTTAAAGGGRAACRRAFSGLPGATAVLGAAGCRAPHLGGGHPARATRPAARRATSGSRAAASGGPSRTSSSRPPCSPPCARPGRCPSPRRRPRRNTSPSAAPCWSSGWPRWPAKAAADGLEDVRIKDGELKITPLKAVTPEEAEALADRLYGMTPNARITERARRRGSLDRVQRRVHPPAHRPAGG